MIRDRWTPAERRGSARFAMLIVCPSCASQYTIDPARVGTDGRIVRCARCRTTWFAASDEPTAYVGSIAANAEERQSGGRLTTTISVEARSERLRADDEAGTAPMSPARLKMAKPRASSERPRNTRAGFPISVAVLILVLTIVAVAGRTSVVTAFPGAARLYAAAGWPVNLRGVAFSDIRSGIAFSDGTAVLVVEGEVRNVTRGEVGVPPIQIAVRGSDGQPLYTWTDDPPSKTLDRGEVARFRARLASPPAEARDVLVRFGAASEGGH